MVKVREEDVRLAPEQFPGMNRQFYSAKLAPHDYLQYRLRSILLAAQTPQSMPAIWDTDIEYGTLKMNSSPGDDVDDDQVRDYVNTETTVLLHHAAEALLRLYLAHEGDPPCPWLEVARLRIPSHFKERVESFLKELGTPETRSSLMLIVAGHPEPPADDAEKWNKMADGAVRFMGTFAHMLLKDAPLYNAAKHGLAVRAGDESVKMEPNLAEYEEGPGIDLGAEGPSVACLTVGQGEYGRRWRRRTTWIHHDQNVGYTYIAIAYIRGLWEVAKFRYVGGEFDTSKVTMFDAEMAKQVEQLGNRAAKTFVIPFMEMDLAYYAAPDDNTEPS